VLLVQQGMGFLERLQLRDLARGARRRGLAGSPAEPTVARILPPLGQHVRMDLQCEGNGSHLQSWLLTQSNGSELELVTVLADRSRS
jgi:hypothetical protein